ncbi:hypothetical protein FLL85_17615 [Vibrio cholerae]|nr:hypothetical protein FLL85_17615 [Vibrio cholerae]
MQLLCLSLVVMRCQPLRRALSTCSNTEVIWKKLLIDGLAGSMEQIPETSFLTLSKMRMKSQEQYG